MNPAAKKTPTAELISSKLSATVALVKMTYFTKQRLLVTTAILKAVGLNTTVTTSRLTTMRTSFSHGEFPSFFIISASRHQIPEAIHRHNQAPISAEQPVSTMITLL